LETPQFWASFQASIVNRVSRRLAPAHLPRQAFTIEEGKEQTQKDDTKYHRKMIPTVGEEMNAERPKPYP